MKGVTMKMKGTRRNCKMAGKNKKVTKKPHGVAYREG